MTPIDILAVLPIMALFSFIWASLQTEEANGPKSYKRTSPDLWVEKTIKIQKPKYPNLSDPVMPEKTGKP
jgi:hypothetical protein